MKKVLLFVLAVFGCCHVQAQIISAFAGNDTRGYTGDSISATAAEFYYPSAVVGDGYGNIYIADQGNYRIRKVTPAGIIYTIAGTGIAGYNGDSILAATAQLDNPTGLAIDKYGNIYIAEESGNRVRKIDTFGYIHTIAGTGANGFSGDGGNATAAKLSYPLSVAVDTNGIIYIADLGNEVIRKIDASGNISTFAGTAGVAGYYGDGEAATNAGIDYPQSVAADHFGNVFISDEGNSRIRVVNATGIINTCAGTGISGFSGDLSPATAAKLYDPAGLAVDVAGNLIFADKGNERIRKVNALTGIITTIAGNGSVGYSGDGGAATAAELYDPADVYVDASNELFIADQYNYRVRKVNCSAPSVPAITGGATVRVETTLTLSDSISGGIWSLSNANASISASGVITGNVVGIDTAYYTVFSACSSAYAYTIITVNPYPCAGVIKGGESSLCTGVTISLSDSISGGIWFATNTNCSVSGGVVTALSGGFDTICYAVSGGCGIDTTQKVIYVNTPASYYNITTPAGDGLAAFGGDGGAATFASINSPSGIVADRSGNTYILDQGNNRIRKINAAGVITTIAGNGTAGYSGDGGAATAASLAQLQGIALDGAGNIYLTAGSGSSSYAVRKISTSGIITTIAGSGSAGYGGDGAAATAATLNQPSGIAVDKMGNIYIADRNNNRVRKINTAGIITTIAGNGSAGYIGDGGAATAAELNLPIGVAVDTNGNIFVSEFANYTVRKINAPGIISTVAGNNTPGFSGDGGAATAAMITPAGIAVDNYNNLFIADLGNQVIRQVNGFGNISTIAGTPGSSGFGGDGGAATSAYFYYPSAVTIDTFGNLLIADNGNNRIRKLLPISNGITGTGSVCVGASMILSDSNNGVNIWSAANANATINSAGMVTGVTAGTDVISCTVFNACGGSAATTTISVNALPTSGTVVINGSTSEYVSSNTVCTSFPVNMYNYAGGGFWRMDTNTHCATIDSVSGHITIAYSGIANIHYVVTSGGCTATTTFGLYIDTLPTPLSIVGSSVICVSDTAHFSDTILSNGYVNPSGVGSHIPLTWSSSNESVATISSRGIASGVASGITTISFSATNSCGTITVTQPTTVQAVPTSSGTISGYSLVHAGAVITLSETETGGIWTASNSNATISSSGILSGVTTGRDTIKYTIANSCGAAVAAKIVSVGACSAAAPVTGPATVCIGIPTTFTDTTAGGTWSVSNTSLLHINDSGIVSLATTGIDTLYFTYSNACDSGVASAVVTISPAVLVSRISGPGYLCLLSTATFTDSLSGGVWSASNGVVSITDSGVVTANFPGLDTITYSVTNMCGTSTAQTVLVVYPITAGTITGPDYVCTGSHITLTDSTFGGTWSTGGSGASVSSGGVVTGVMPGVVAISYSISNPCLSSVTAHSISVFPTTVAAITGYTAPACRGARTTLSDATPGGVWSLSNNNDSISATGVFKAILYGNDTVSYTVSTACGTYAATVSIHVDYDTVAPIVGPDTVCIGNTITLSDPYAGYRGSIWTLANSHATISGSGVLTGVSSGVEIVTYSIYTATRCSGPSTRYTTKAVRIGTDVSSITGNSTICLGADSLGTLTDTLTDSVPYGAWNASNGTVMVSSAGIVSPVHSGIDTLSYTVTSGCGVATATKILTVYPTTFTNISGPEYICAGSAITLFDSTVGGSWSSGSAIATVSPTGMVHGLSSGSVTITYSVSGACVYGVSIHPITVYPTGTGYLEVLDSTLCVGSLESLYIGSWPTTGYWHVFNSKSTFDSSHGTWGDLTAMSAGIDTISYGYTNVCGAYFDTAMVTNVSHSLAPITGADSVCITDSIMLMDSSSGGIWTASNISAVVSHTGVVTGYYPGIDTISYSLTNACGSLTANLVVVVGPFVPAISGSTDVCEGSSILLTEALSGGTWSATNSLASVNTAGSVTGIAPGADTILYTASTTCGSAIASKIVTVSIFPTIGTIIALDTLCMGISDTVMETSPGGHWMIRNPRLMLTDSVSGNADLSASAGGLDTILYVISNACGTDTATHKIFIKALPVVGAITGPTYVCMGSTGTFIDSSSLGRWKLSDSLFATVSSTGMITPLLTGTDTLMYVETNTCGTVAAKKYFAIDTLPAIRPIMGTGTVCVGGTLSLTDSTTGGTWASVNNTIATILPVHGVVRGVNTGVDTLKYTISNTCGASVVVTTVTVNPSNNRITGSDTAVCVGNIITLHDTTSGGVWTSENGSVATVSSGIVSGIATGTDVIEYIVPGACPEIATYNISVVYLPIVVHISGQVFTCVGYTDSLLGSPSGGKWTASNGNVTIDSMSGSMTGVAAGLDTVKYSYTNICGTKDTTVVITVYNDHHCWWPAGVAQPESETDIMIYPNPTTREFAIVMPGRLATNGVTVSVEDVLGKTIMQEKEFAPGIGKLAINLQNAQTGTYFVVIKTGDGIYRKKLVKW